MTAALLIGFGVTIAVIGCAFVVPQIAAAARGRSDLTIEWVAIGAALVGAGAAFVGMGAAA